MTASAPGLRISVGGSGNLRVAASATAEPMFTSIAARMWDSAAPTAGTAITRAYGYSSACAAFKDDVIWNVLSTVQADAGTVSKQAFGMRAGSESNDLGWKQFDSGSSNITLSVTYG